MNFSLNSAKSFDHSSLPDYDKDVFEIYFLNLLSLIVFSNSKMFSV